MQKLSSLCFVLTAAAVFHLQPGSVLAQGIVYPATTQMVHYEVASFYPESYGMVSETIALPSTYSSPAPMNTSVVVSNVSSPTNVTAVNATPNPIYVFDRDVVERKVIEPAKPTEHVTATVTSPVEVIAPVYSEPVRFHAPPVYSAPQPQYAACRT